MQMENTSARLRGEGMSYDKSSFLAGLAAGRNMESWPAMEGEGENVFKITVQVEAGDFYTPWMAFDGWIVWGDGEKSRVSNIPRDYEYNNERFRSRTYHTYESGGIYQITWIGNLLDWSIRRSSTDLATSDYLISIDTPFPRSMEARTFLDAICYGCEALVSLPPKLFQNCPNLERLNGFCYRCSSLTTIPEKLFWNCHALKSVSRFFMSCDLESLPSDLFAQTPNLEIAAGMISYNPRITSIPHGLLDPLQNLQRIAFNSLGITTLPNGLFANCPDMENFDQLCLDDSQLTRIPSDLFRYTPSAHSFSGTFSGTAITSIPSTLFSNCPMADNFTSCFSSCGEITGAVPELWVSFPDADGRGCFFGCVNASNYGDIPSGWR